MTQLKELTERASDGDPESEQKLIEFFLPRALKLAQQKIHSDSQSNSDSQAPGNSAINSLCARIHDGKLVFHHDNQLMGVLRRIIANKARKFWHYHPSQENDDVFPEAGIDPADAYLNDGPIEIDETDSRTVVEILSSLEQELHGLFSNLTSTLEPDSRDVLLMLLERDYSNEELAGRMDRPVNSVMGDRNSIRESLKQLMA